MFMYICILLLLSSLKVHAQGVYLTQYTSRMGTARVKQEVRADTSIIAIE